VGGGAAAPQPEWDVAHRWLCHALQGLPRNRSARESVPGLLLRSGPIGEGDSELAPIEGFGLQKKARGPGDYLAYTPADLNRGWHEEWFYIRKPAGNPFLSFTGGGGGPWCG
jgi:hypothetical protein